MTLTLQRLNQLRQKCTMLPDKHANKPISARMKYLTVGCLVFLFGSVFCQVHPNDSLDYHIEKAESPEEKVRMLNNASASLSDANLNRSLD